MLQEQRSDQRARRRRQRRVRAVIRGRADQPRLSVFRSLKHLSLQLIDDKAQRTLITVTDRHLPPAARGRPVERARAVGRLLAERAKALGIRQVVFDRGRYHYHGQVQAAAEGAREAGLTF